MKLSQQSNNEYFGRYEENEDLKNALLDFCKENNIQTAHFSIIGAVKESEFGFYDQREKKYFTMKIPEEAEILNCTGNIALKDGEPFLHAHITLADTEGRAYGGHLISAKVFAAEIYLKKFDKSVERKPDSSTKLSLLEP